MIGLPGETQRLEPGANRRPLRIDGRRSDLHRGLERDQTRPGPELPVRDHRRRARPDGPERRLRVGVRRRPLAA